MHLMIILQVLILFMIVTGIRLKVSSYLELEMMMKNEHYSYSTMVVWNRIILYTFLLAIFTAV